MGRSGLEVHSWTMQSLSSCWMLCFCTYCSHSLRLRSSSLLVLPDAMTKAVTPALRPLAFDLGGVDSGVEGKHELCVVRTSLRHAPLLVVCRSTRESSVCLRDEMQGDGKCEKSRASVRTRGVLPRHRATSAYRLGVSGVETGQMM